MRLIHVMRALRAVTTREVLKFVQQRGRLLSALVRPLMWLTVFAAGFYNVFGVSQRGMIRRTPQAQPA
jgi:ABC-2 type transport system permease protein